MLTVGHRGVMGVEPENTLRSFVRAEREGLDVLELDLHLSKDGELVVMHDADVARTTDGSGPIGDFTLAELRELDAGEGERVPVFDEVVDAVSSPSRRRSRTGPPHRCWPGRSRSAACTSG